MIGIFLIGIISAADDNYLGTFQRGDCANLYQYCDNCTYVNLTRIQRTGSEPNTWIVGLDMEGNGDNYNYTFCDTTIIGSYKYTVCGDKDGKRVCEDLNFEVTPSGFIDTLGFFFLILILSLGLVVLGFFMEDYIVMILGSFGLYFLGIYTLFNGIAGIKDSVVTWALSIIILGLAFYVSVRSTYELIQDSSG